MFGDIFKSVFKKPATEKYPFKKYPVPETLHGKVVYDPQTCTGCMMCVRDCPAGALDLVVIDRATKRFVMKYSEQKCVYCALCVQVCKFNTLHMSDEVWELASVVKTPFEVIYGREEDLQTLMERDTQAAGTQEGQK
jgi:formate hydrogenlyase subunit 6/NADH:ubiquinone oxidoreductase subunit I